MKSEAMKTLQHACEKKDMKKANAANILLTRSEELFKEGNSMKRQWEEKNKNSKSKKFKK